LYELAIKMNENMFKKLGFKCGLEIHQQLKTSTKLFCNCPTGYRNDAPDAEIIRHMRPTLSELGEYDGTALMEFKTKKRVIYQLYRNNMCTYEMDDTPPFTINKKALQIAIRLALMLNCAVIDELHVSRKQYLDGSIPTGFQRTAIVGVGGWVPYKDRKIMLSHICLEEDACREVSDNGHDIIFRTDRLSSPLVEVITQPVLETPREAREVNELIGRMLKASGLVRRGIGSVRQDVNVSITGGTRVEMKGISKTEYVERMTAIEALRQKYLLDIKDELQKRGYNKSSFTPVKKDVTDILNIRPSSLIASVTGSGNRFGAVKLPGFAGLLKREIQPRRTFADEFSGRVKVIACLDKMPNIAVNEIPLPVIDSDCWNKLAKELDTSDKDAIVLTWGPRNDIATAMNEIVIRAEEAFDGVPNDTRQHLSDFTTGFERVLPGPDRMYPDTDSPPVAIPACDISNYKRGLPKRSWEYESEWEKLGTPIDISHKVVVSPLLEMFDRLVKQDYINPVKLYSMLKRVYKVNKSVIDFNIDTVASILDRQKQGRLTLKTVEKLFVGSTPAELEPKFSKLISEKSELSDSDIRQAIAEAIKQAEQIDFANNDVKTNYIIGVVMRRFEEAVDGGRVRNLVIL